jgi:ketosteroid isomerase-like protein
MDSMPALNPKEVVQTYVAAFNRGDVDDVCRCFAPDALV